MTIRRAQPTESQRAMALAGNGWNMNMVDPAAIPPPGSSNQSVSGVTVNERSILSLMAMAACMRVLGDATSGLVVHVHRMQGSKPSFDDPEVDPPDVIMSPCADIDREQANFNCIASWCLGGNAYYDIVDWKGGGRTDPHPAQVEILNPSQMLVRLEKGTRVYRIGTITAPPIPLKDMIHVPWLSLPQGLVGLNPVEIGAVAFGNAIATNEYVGRYFSQGIHPTGLLSIDKPVLQKDKKRIVDELMTQHGGLAQSHTPVVLDSGTKWTQISVNPATAQLLETRGFSRSEIAGFYGVPGHLIGDVQDSETYGKGLQEMVMGFAMFGLSGYTRRLDRMDSALLPAGYYVRRDCSDLFKTNDQMLGELVSALRQSAIATPNEARKMLRLPPSFEAGADSLWGPINSAHADFMIQGGGAVAGAIPQPNSQIPSPLPPKGQSGPIAGQQTGRSASRLPLVGGGSSAQYRAVEDFQKSQGHGYHGYFEGGKGAAPAPLDPDRPMEQDAEGNDIPNGEDPNYPGESPVLTDTSWRNGNKDMTWQNWAQVLSQNGNGFTVGTNGEVPTTGFQVGGVAQPLTLNTSDPIAGGKLVFQYMTANGIHFSAKQRADGSPAMYVGGWKDDNGNFVVEPSQNMQGKYASVKASVERNQVSLWDNAAAASSDPKAVPEIFTYGTGEFGKANSNYVAPTIIPAIIHPGYSSDGKENMDASEASKLSPDNQAKQVARLASPIGQKGVPLVPSTPSTFDKNGNRTTKGNMVTRLDKGADEATPQEIADGLTWYPRVNAAAEILSQKYGMAKDKVVGVLAALSTQTQWGSNVAMAEYMVSAVTSGQKVDIPDDVLTAANSVQGRGRPNGLTMKNDVAFTKQDDLMSASQALMAQARQDKVKCDPQWGVNGTKGEDGTYLTSVHVACGLPGVGKALEIAMGTRYGTQDSATPANTLQGQKTRSFYNNIGDPSDPLCTTMDGYAFGVALGTGYSSDEVKWVSGGSPSSVAENTQGTYALVADAYREGNADLTAQTGVSMVLNAYQAIEWVHAKDIQEGKPSPKITAPVRPVYADE